MTDRNVVLVTADSVRADHCGFMNPDVDTTPFMDRLAHNGVVFENAISPGPRTFSSVPPTHTGESLPVYDDGLNSYESRVDAIRRQISEYTTIAEQFQSKGYSTLGVSANPWTSTTSEFDTGFDTFIDIADSYGSHVSSWFENTKLGPLARIASQWWNNDIWFSQWPTFYKRIRSALTDLDEPYFVWIFLIDPHNPYIVPKEDRVESSALSMYYGLGRGNTVLRQRSGTSALSTTMPASVESTLKRAYRDSIRSTDRFVETLWSDLKEDDPLFAFHSDHGEAFGEHGSYGHQPELFEVNVHVPLALFNAGTTGRVTKPISLRALPKLLAQYASGDTSDPSAACEDSVIASTEDGGQFAIRDESVKIVRDADNERIYSIARGDDQPIGADEYDAERIDALRETLDAFVADLPRGSSDRSTEAEREEEHGEDVQERLQSLGYLTDE